MYHNKSEYMSVSFDGFSSEASFIFNKIYDYFTGKNNSIGFMDMNHAKKSHRLKIMLDSAVKQVGLDRYGTIIGYPKQNSNGLVQSFR